LVFNALTHDALLRRRGQYERMQSTIRRRDVRLQGAPNPAVDRPQLAQFAGRDVERDWQCPVEVNPA
jgi:FPC/CPF motif-containing protein YcgG